MAIEKPSDKEAEYFARKEYERLKALAEKRKASEQEAERQARRDLHHMHCPKCGDDLAEIEVRGVKLDKCPGCAGLWLDAGELETILREEDTTLMKKILKVFQ